MGEYERNVIEYIKEHRTEECCRCSKYYLSVGLSDLAFREDMIIRQSCYDDCWIDKWRWSNKVEICKNLKTWDEKVKEQTMIANDRYLLSGIACPECGAELMEDRKIILTSYPPKHNYNCPKCKWRGTA